ncbi:hypothetical protein LCGC14_2673320 [marine sediment metagenome]|uniref:Uncharacterized protein n=1 Tax=marine sediment metagenome TaxID=412755 RepID=A0A0F9CFG4_9ZZZZ
MIGPVLIAKENVPVILQAIGTDIEDVVDTFTMGYCTYNQVVLELYNAQRQLWILATDDMHIQGWLVTKLLNIAFGRRLVLDLFGGKDVDLLLSHLEKVEDWAKQYGATEPSRTRDQVSARNYASMVSITFVI